MEIQIEAEGRKERWTDNGRKKDKKDGRKKEGTVLSVSGEECLEPEILYFFLVFGGGSMCDLDWAGLVGLRRGKGTKWIGWIVCFWMDQRMQSESTECTNKDREKNQVRQRWLS